MKSLQKLKLILILFLALSITQSCDKDDFIDQFNPDTVADAVDPETNDQSDENNNDDDDDWDDSNWDDDDGENSDSAGGDGSITLYKVEGNTISKTQNYDVSGQLKEAQDDVAKHQEIWELIKKIVPENYMSKIGEFVIYWGDADGSSGYVTENSADLSVWKMGIAIDYAYEGGFNADGELAYTIIHEFGHILTLDNTQVDASVSENNCQNFFTGEGCAKTNSYINQLQTRFWADIWSEFEKARESESGMQDFYSKHRDRFVTQYAATNPGEDIAEVFATFVTSNNNPNGISIADKKVQLMYDYPELIALRDFVRGNTANAKGRSYLPVAGTWKKANTLGNPKKGCSHKK